MTDKASEPSAAKTALETARAHLGAHHAELVDSLRAALAGHASTHPASLPPERLAEIGRATAEAFQRFAGDLETDAVREYGAKLAQEGLSWQSSLVVTTALRQACWDASPTRTKSDRQGLQALLQTVDRYEAAFLAGWLAHAERETREGQAQLRRDLNAALQQQHEQEARLQRAIGELAAPVIQVWEGVLVLPLVGAIDSRRARRMTEDLLNGIKDLQAEQVIIDITGVPVVDTNVANHLLQTIKAARLLGARCLLVGITAEVAQTMVHLGIDLSGVTTRANLQAGIEYALAQMGLGVASLVSET